MAELKKQMLTAWLKYTEFEVVDPWDLKEKWDLYFEYARLRDKLYENV